MKTASITAIQKRPGMYFGDLDTEVTYFHLLEYILCGVWFYTDILSIDIIIDKNIDYTITVTPFRWPILSNGKPDLASYLTNLQDETNQESDKLQDIWWWTVVNGLSSCFTIELQISEQLYCYAFQQGEFVSEEIQGIDSKKYKDTGSICFHFQPDPAIFQLPPFPLQKFLRRLNDLAYLHPKTCIQFTDPSNTSHRFLYPDGFKQSMRGSILMSIVTLVDDFDIQVVIADNSGNSMQIRSFANDVPTVSGTHELGVCNGLLRALRELSNNKSLALRDLHVEMVVSVRSPSIKYANPTRDIVRNKSLLHIMEELVYRQTMATGSDALNLCNTLDGNDNPWLIATVCEATDLQGGEYYDTKPGSRIRLTYQARPQGETAQGWYLPLDHHYDIIETAICINGALILHCSPQEKAAMNAQPEKDIDPLIDTNEGRLITREFIVDKARPIINTLKRKPVSWCSLPDMNRHDSFYMEGERHKSFMVYGSSVHTDVFNWSGVTESDQLYFHRTDEHWRLVVHILQRKHIHEARFINGMIADHEIEDLLRLVAGRVITGS